MTKERLWKMTGTRAHRTFYVKVRAKDHNEAVMKGSKQHMLVMKSAVLQDEEENTNVSPGSL